MTDIKSPIVTDDFVTRIIAHAETISRRSRHDTKVTRAALLRLRDSLVGLGTDRSLSDPDDYISAIDDRVILAS